MTENILLGVDEIELTNDDDIPQLLHDKDILEDGTNSNSSNNLDKKKTNLIP